MKAVTFYDEITGIPHSHWLGPDHLIEANTPIGHKAYDGYFDMRTRRVDISTGELIDYRPPAPSINHAWNDKMQRHELTEDALKRHASLTRQAELIAQQHDLVRALVLNPLDASAKTALFAIDDEILKLRASLAT